MIYSYKVPEIIQCIQFFKNQTVSTVCEQFTPWESQPWRFVLFWEPKNSSNIFWFWIIFFYCTVTGTASSRGFQTELQSHATITAHSLVIHTAGSHTVPSNQQRNNQGQSQKHCHGHQRNNDCQFRVRVCHSPDVISFLYTLADLALAHVEGVRNALCMLNSLPEIRIAVTLVVGDKTTRRIPLFAEFWLLWNKEVKTVFGKLVLWPLLAVMGDALGPIWHGGLGWGVRLHLPKAKLGSHNFGDETGDQTGSSDWE